jgi:hypothetical protein
MTESEEIIFRKLVCLRGQLILILLDSTLARTVASKKILVFVFNFLLMIQLRPNN